mgnify:CR=1 FL=1
MDGMARKEKKEKRKIENRVEKRRSVIHTDSVVMKGIESFIITGRTEGVPSIFKWEEPFEMGVYMFRAYSISWGRQHVFPSTGPGMELRTAFLLFSKNIYVLSGILYPADSDMFSCTLSIP